MKGEKERRVGGVDVCRQDAGAVRVFACAREKTDEYASGDGGLQHYHVCLCCC